LTDDNNLAAVHFHFSRRRRYCSDRARKKVDPAPIAAIAANRNARHFHRARGGSTKKPRRHGVVKAAFLRFWYGATRLWRSATVGRELRSVHARLWRVNHEQRTRPQRSRQQRRQCKRPQRSRQQLRHQTCVTLLLSSSMAAAGSGAIGAALAAPGTAARINPATPIAKMVRIIAFIPFPGAETSAPQSHERYCGLGEPSVNARRGGARRK
jgi:hypothetical protein